jgi:hypothetical protein
MSEHLQSLRRAVEEKRVALQTLNTAAGDKPLTKEQQVQWDTLTGEIEAGNTRIGQLEQAAKLAPVKPTPASAVSPMWRRSIRRAT